MLDADKLKKKVQKLSALLDFYENLKDRDIKGEKELMDTKLKMDFAKKQIIKLCLESKKIIKDTEYKEMIKDG